MKPSSNGWTATRARTSCLISGITHWFWPTWDHLWYNVWCCLLYSRGPWHSLLDKGKVFATSIKRSLELTLGIYFHINVIFSSVNQKCSETFISDVSQWKIDRNPRAVSQTGRLKKASCKKMFLNCFVLKIPQTGRQREVSLHLTFKLHGLFNNILY